VSTFEICDFAGQTIFSYTTSTVEEYTLSALSFFRYMMSTVKWCCYANESGFVTRCPHL